VSATNRNVEQSVKEGKLREDLFYRLNVIRLDIPPLRERSEDISLLAESFVHAFSNRRGKSINGFSPEALNALNNYHWPGNVRELENCIERAAVLAKGERIEKTDLPSPVSGVSEEARPGNFPTTLDLREIEKHAVTQALEETNWNKVRAAEKLGIFPSSLYKKMKRYGIPQNRPQ
jgi:two-component system response regulator HydG